MNIVTGELQQRLSVLNEVAGLTTFWPFVTSQPDFGVVWRRAIFPVLYSRRRPPQEMMRPLFPNDTWVVYFAFCPNDRVEPHHLFTLARIKDSGLKTFVICAASAPGKVPRELSQQADALFWKAFPGYDFSAYTLALEQVSEHSPGATVLLMNDSVFGPFADLRTFIQTARQDLTGFTAYGLAENHIQSYAFLIKNVTPQRLRELRDVMYEHKAYNRAEAVIWCQETRLARAASQHMTVGAFIYCEKGKDDPCLRRPFDLLDAGFPFMKRSLLGKMKRFQDPERVLQYLAQNHHPPIL